MLAVALIIIVIALLLGFVTVGTLAALVQLFLPFLITGIIVGVLARLVVPGRQAMGVMATVLYGIAGAFLGGWLASQVLGAGGLASFLVQVLMAAALIAAFAGPRYGYTRTRGF